MRILIWHTMSSCHPQLSSLVSLTLQVSLPLLFSCIVTGLRVQMPHHPVAIPQKHNLVCEALLPS